MRIRRALISGVILAALLLSSGCDRSDQSASAPLTDVHHRMKTALQQANTGSFVERTVSVQGSGVFTETTRGTYNLTDRSWQTRLRYSSQPTDLLEQIPRRLRSGVDTRAVDSHFYLSLPSWPQRLHGRWAEIHPTAASDRDSSGRPVLPSPSFFPVALTSMQPLSVVRHQNGWTLRGRIGADLALEGLGLDSELRQQKIAVDQLSGSGEVVVEIGPDYRPTEVRLDGKTVSVKSGLPEAVAKDLAFMRTTTVLTGLGTGRPITAPTGRNLVASEQVPAAA